MAEQLLRRLDVNTLLTQHRSQPMYERMPADPLLDPYPFQGWPDVTLECPALFVPVLMRETGRKGADDGEGQEAYP